MAGITKLASTETDPKVAFDQGTGNSGCGFVQYCVGLFGSQAGATCIQCT